MRASLDTTQFEPLYNWIVKIWKSLNSFYRNWDLYNKKIPCNLPRSYVEALCDLIKRIWSKLTLSFWKQHRFINVNIAFTNNVKNIYSIKVLSSTIGSTRSFWRKLRTNRRKYNKNGNLRTLQVLHSRVGSWAYPLTLD